MQLSPRAKAQVDTCVHCGLCLESCPTYKEWGIEDSSPRGRIHLARNLEAGVIGPTDKVLEHFDLCLGCRACETACPSGVKYGAIIEDVRAKLEKGRERTYWARTLRKLFLEELLPHPSRLRTLAKAFRLTQKLKLDKFAVTSGLIKLIPKQVADMADVARVSDTFGAEVLPERVAPVGTKRYTVAFITGCVMDVMFGATNIASVQVLAANGCEVIIPRAQSCCGALPQHAGDEETAKQQARRNIDVFLGSGADYIIINAAGCGSTLKEYHHLLHDDPSYADRAQVFAAMVRDISEFLGTIDLVEPPIPIQADVTYQDACHLAHGQGIRLQPRKVLVQIKGIRMRALADPDVCCGSAGIYNLVQPEMAGDVLRRKMGQIEATRAKIVVSGNPGCIMQLRLGAKQRGLDIEVLHIIDLLARAYGPVDIKGA